MITNSTGLPLPLYLAIKNDEYSRGSANISVTSLSKPPRMVALEEAFAGKLIQDASTMSFQFIGKVVHEYIAKHSTGDLDDKDRLFSEFLGWVVSGQTDNYLDGKITDWKVVSVNEWKFGLKAEREEQLNCYAELLRRNGHPVTSLAACLIFRDYSPMRSGFEANYPPASIVEMDVPLWDSERAVAFIEGRVALHQAARKELPLCTDAETWGETTFAVVKDGAKRATRVFAKREEAEADISTRGFEYNVEERISEPRRCMFYCDVAAVCEQWAGNH